MDFRTYVAAKLQKQADASVGGLPFPAADDMQNLFGGTQVPPGSEMSGAGGQMPDAQTAELIQQLLSQQGAAAHMPGGASAQDMPQGGGDMQQLPPDMLEALKGENVPGMEGQLNDLDRQAMERITKGEQGKLDEMMQGGAGDEAAVGGGKPGDLQAAIQKYLASQPGLTEDTESPYKGLGYGGEDTGAPTGDEGAGQVENMPSTPGVPDVTGEGEDVAGWQGGNNDADNEASRQAMERITKGEQDKTDEMMQSRQNEIDQTGEGEKATPITEEKTDNARQDSWEDTGKKPETKEAPAGEKAKLKRTVPTADEIPADFRARISDAYEELAKEMGVSPEELRNKGLLTSTVPGLILLRHMMAKKTPAKK